MTGAITTIIPAAGASRRLGYPKQLAAFEGESLLRRAARRAIDAGLGRVIIVLGFEAERLSAELDGLRCEVLVIDDWEEGMAASIRVGVTRAATDPAAIAVLVTLVDQWALTTSDLVSLADAWRADGCGIAAAEYPDGTVAVPAIFSREHFDALRALEGDAGARHLLRSPRVKLTRLPMPTAAPDFDQPA